MMSAMSRSSSTTRMSTSVILASTRQHHHEAGAARLTVLDVNRATVQFHQRLHNRQPESAAGFAVPNSFATTIELVEDHVALQLWHTGPVVGDCQLHMAIFGPRRHRSEERRVGKEGRSRWS